ncbi:metallophosphoesterase [Asanoa sp. WMMD1127]|uniref:metallophosphoesterase n=1 Tax=Asanoa sp. WMMD1127 TaxID=3016107 RepID=UPI002417A2B2|nr:metallophosphoesterase [Asanoa sp. WMMD1127]MDG4822118.1 metallophosphoesterase [Asanoa sp. WMMD1127]
MGIILFVGLAFVVIGLIHLYLWKRLVKDTTRPGRWRRVGAGVAVVLGLLVPATLIGTRTGVTALAWPGYLWIALMFYLLVVLVLLEIPMLLARIVLRRRAAQPAAQRVGQTVGTRLADGPEDRSAFTDHTAAGDGKRPATTNDHTTAADATPTAATNDHTTAADATPTAATNDHTTAADAAPTAATDDHTADDEPGAPAGIERRLVLARGAAIFAGLTAAGITGYGVRTALGSPRLDRVQITLAKLPRTMDGLRIATVSDIHLGPLAGRAHTERVVAAINRTQADIVAVVGDLVDGSVSELGAAAAPLREIQSRHGAFFVTGNHEYYSGAEEWLAEVERLGIRTLRNQRQLIRANGGAIDLAGVNDIAGEGTSTGGPDIPGTLKDRDPKIPVVLLAHQPVQVHDAAEHGVDLQLSGHTHGGQMVPFNYAVRLEQPVVSGYGRFRDTQLYVTNGAGFWGPPVRVGAPPQVTLVELRSA